MLSTAAANIRGVTTISSLGKPGGFYSPLGDLMCAYVTYARKVATMLECGSLIVRGFCALIS
jgi:hypothetical protein